MGTSNFLIENASAAYAVKFLENSERHSIEEDEDDSDQWSFWWSVERLGEFLKEAIEKDHIKIKKVTYDLARSVYAGDRVSVSHGRNFYESGVCGFTLHRDYNVAKEEWVTLEVDIGIVSRNGYYEGSNLDYVIGVNIDGMNMDWERNKNGQGTELEYLKYNYYRYGITHKKAAQIDRWIDQWVNQHALPAIEDYVNQLLQAHSAAYLIAGRFSNGETLYQKIN